MALSSFFSARLLRLTDLITRLQGGEGGIKGEGFEKQRRARERRERNIVLNAVRLLGTLFEPALRRRKATFTSAEKRLGARTRASW